MDVIRNKWSVNNTNQKEIKEIGYLNEKVIDTFSLSYKNNQPILIGKSNINHMKKEHPLDYDKYGKFIPDIISKPDYIAKHPKKESIEFIKKFYTNKIDYVLVAVRASGGGELYTRTLFIMTDVKVEMYKKKRALIPYK